MVFFGSGCAVPNIPSVNTRISGYIDWIRAGVCDLSDEKPDSCFDTKSPTKPPTLRPVPSPISLAPVTRPPTTVRPVPSPISSAPSTLQFDTISDVDVPAFAPLLDGMPSSTLPPVVQTIYLAPDASLPDNIQFTVESEPFYTDSIPHNFPPEQLDDQQFAEPEDGTDDLPVLASEETVAQGSAAVSQINDVEVAAAGAVSASTIGSLLAALVLPCLVALLAS